ncbi:MAG TPA: competence/damage-inducible protein A [Rhizomicrobium sp.]|nr:competence/damage-inducible protein A [Rhizomicrobium sp.]
MDRAEAPTAAMLAIGDEILSGRTQDTNTNYVARFLATLGINLREARVVPDVEMEIVAAVNALRTRYGYVFVTGGIGPTHDDITADAIAKAFNVSIDHHPEALALIGARYEPEEFNEMRRRMARIPAGAALIRNSVSAAPGFQLENVFVMAGVPMIMRAMLEDVAPQLKKGPPVHTSVITAPVAEGRIAAALVENPAALSEGRGRELFLLSRGRFWGAAGGPRTRFRTGGCRGDRDRKGRAQPGF